jgi:hypothetical protein
MSQETEVAMADPTEPVFSDAFADAMKRITEKRQIGQVKHKLLRRSGLNIPGLPQASFSVLNFLGWLHSDGKLRPAPSKAAT